MFSSKCIVPFYTDKPSEVGHDVPGLFRKIPLQFRGENFRFEEWLQAWLDGYDLWKNE